MFNRIILRKYSSLHKTLQFSFGRVKFPLPDLGQKIKQGTVKKLYVNEGDQVTQFQKIADVQSDKQFTQITSPEVGVIAKLYYKQSEVCKVGDLFLQIQTGKNIKGEPSSSVKPQKKQTQQKAAQKHQQAINEQVLSSPVVRMFAKSNNIDLNKVKGTGKRGRVLKQDLINYLQGKAQSKVEQKAQKIKSISNQNRNTNQIQSQIKVKMNAFQKGMQKSMTQANKVPHLYYDQKMDVTQLDSMRQKMKKSGIKVTIMGILTKTFSLALNHHPKINSLYKSQKNEFEYQIQQSHNISLAIDTPNGLVVPNIKNVQNLSIIQIQEKLSELKKLADSARLTKQYLQGGTICLSNIGTIAGISACPLILCPQTCIVAIGKVMETPSYYGSQFIRKKHITMSFGCDHRIIDGGSIARFSNQWKNIIQNPYFALVKMR